MVSTRFGSSSCASWQPRSTPTHRGFSRAPNPPPVPPKPGGKMYVYVYETPGNNAPREAIDLAESGNFPSNHQLVVDEDHALLDHEEGFVNLNDLQGNNSIINKVKRQAKKGGRGFKVLADVTPSKPRSTSRGGRMFIKQKNRMERYTSPAMNGRTFDFDEEVSEEEEEAHLSVNRKPNAAGNYIPPSSYYNNTPKERKRKGQLLPPLRSPPPEWRAKVESNYKIVSADPSLRYKRRNRDFTQTPIYSLRSESAPPPLQSQTSCGSLFAENERRQSGSVTDDRSETENTFRPASAVHFDARKHRQAPDRKQGARAGRGVFMTTPHVEHDFNARAVGWSKSYANRY